MVVRPTPAICAATGLPDSPSAAGTSFTLLPWFAVTTRSRLPRASPPRKAVSKFASSTLNTVSENTISENMAIVMPVRNWFESG